MYLYRMSFHFTLLPAGWGGGGGGGVAGSRLDIYLGLGRISCTPLGVL
jgi:hypothetical protein